MKLIKVRKESKEVLDRTKNFFEADESIFERKDPDVNELLDSLTPQQRIQILDELSVIKQVLNNLENRVASLETKKEQEFKSVCQQPI